MTTNLLWKLGLIVIVVAGAAWFAYPLDQINLGLDLRGGAHILMQVDVDSALEYERGLTQSRIGQALKDADIEYEAVRDTGVATLEIRGADPSRSEEVRDILDLYRGGWEISDLGSGSWRMTMRPEQRSYYATTAVDTTLRKLRERVDGLGVREPLIQKQGLTGDRILVQLPGVEDINQVKGILQEPALLEWKKVSYPPGVSDFGTWLPATSEQATINLFGGVLPEDTAIYPEERTNLDGTTVTLYWPLKRVSTIVGNDLKNAVRDVNNWRDPVVRFELTPEAGRRFESATREYEGKKMAVLLDKKVLTAPRINSVIRDVGIIEGDFTIERAETLALQLKSGALPTDVNIIEERTVGPSLGRDSIRAGVTAALVGFAGVLLFMVVYYRLSGINAVVALALNILLVLGAMAYIDATLTLPGIAGLVLVVGMAVDSNVLIFERIREELRLGKTVRSAVEQGFGRAFMTILDCNVTTLVAAFFLFSYGTGPVKGFAVTLTIGLLASMFTAVFVSRQLFELILGRKRRVESLSI